MYKSPGLLHYHNSPIIQDKLLAQARRATAVNTKQTEELKQTVKIQRKTGKGRKQPRNKIMPL